MVENPLSPIERLKKHSRRSIFQLQWDTVCLITHATKTTPATDAVSEEFGQIEISQKGVEGLLHVSVLPELAGTFSFCTISELKL